MVTHVLRTHIPLFREKQTSPRSPSKLGNAAGNKHKAEMRAKQNCLAGSSEQRQRELVAVCGALSAILAVEHRAVQPHLAHIWQLLWLAAQGKHPPLQTAAILARIMMLLLLLF